MITAKEILSKHSKNYAKIPTAKEILDILIPFKENVSKEENEDSLKQNIGVLTDWVRLHCIEQARVISENVEADFEPMGWLAEQHLSTPFIAGEDYEVPVSRHSILNAYSLDLIK